LGDHQNRHAIWNINNWFAAPDFWELHWVTPSGSSFATYTIAVTRSGGSGESMVEGQICVTNGGGATENLQIVDAVQYKLDSGKFED